MNAVMMASSLPPEKRHSDARSKQHGITGYAKDLIHHTALKMIGKAGIRKEDVEDIEGDLTVELIERLPKFDPHRAAYNTFVANVVRTKAKKILRDRRRERRDDRREDCSLNEYVEDDRGALVERGETMSWEKDDQRLGVRSEGEERDMVIDVETMLSQLPDDMRELCELAKTMPVVEAARRLGIPESTAFSRLRKLRTTFREAGLEDYLHNAS